MVCEHMFPERWERRLQQGAGLPIQSTMVEQLTSTPSRA